MKELSGLSGRRSFFTLSSLLETRDDFGRDAVQKTKKTETNVKDLSGSPGKLSI